MKTLYDYFTAVYATELDNYPYPQIKKSLTRELKENYYVSDLRLSKLIDISCIINKPLHKTVDILYNLKNK